MIRASCPRPSESDSSDLSAGSATAYQALWEDMASRCRLLVARHLNECRLGPPLRDGGALVRPVRGGGCRPASASSAAH